MKKFFKNFLIASGFCLALTGMFGQNFAQEPVQNGARPEEVQSTVSKGAPSQETKASVAHNLFTLLQKEKSGWFTLVLAFLAGVLVSFTPCVYPMIPITVGILQAQASSSLLYNFLSALSYVTGIAVVYAGLGYLSATTSLIFGRWLASPWVIFFMILFFLYMAFSMFGFYEMYSPSFLSRGTQASAKKSLLSSFLFGLISGTVASPCLTPALALLLGVVAKSGNPLFGFAVLFSFSLGMGLLLILVGTFSSTLNMLPRAGLWMDEIKKVFGFMMLGVCVYFAQPIMSSMLTLQLYAGVLGIASVYYFVGAKTSKVKAVVGVLLVLGAIVLILQSLKVIG